MWRRSYRKHVIMAFPSFDTATNSWAPQADISWCTGVDRCSEFVRFHNRLLSENDAVNFALRRSVAWVNQRLKQMQETRSARGDEDRSTALLSEGLTTGSLRSRGSLSHRPASFTYNQFKALIAKLGVNDSEQSLHRSYAALIKLRKTRHCSWTEIREKVRHSREISTALRKNSPRRIKQSQLPLTPQAWQRIV